MRQILATHLKLSPDEIDHLLSMKLDDLLNLFSVRQRLAKVDASLLKQTLPTAGVSLSEKLPSFYNWLKNEFEVMPNPESLNHVTPWLINCFNSKENINRLLEAHSLQPNSRVDIEQMTPALIGLFDEVKDVPLREEWQRTIALVCLLLIVSDREQALSRGAFV